MVLVPQPWCCAARPAEGLLELASLSLPVTKNRQTAKSGQDPRQKSIQAQKKAESNRPW